MRVTLVCVLALSTLAGCSKGNQGATIPVDARRVVSAPHVGVSGLALTQGALEIYVIDVGQGDATLVVGPLENGHRITMLIDAGGGSSARVLGTAMATAAVTSLDIVVATHYDEDHIGGFTTSKGASLLWETTKGADNEAVSCTPKTMFPTLAMVDPGVGDGDSMAEREWELCATNLTGGANQPEHIRVEGGDHIGEFFELGGGYAADIVSGDGHVLGGTERVPGVDTKNERSVAILVSSEEGFHFLVTGDLIGQPFGNETAEVEGPLGEGLAAEGIDLEVLRIGHHGARNASENSFIENTQPEVAIISAGMKNTHGHPHHTTLQTLEANDVPLILQTGPGKLKAPDTSAYEFDECDDDDLDCTPSIRFIVNGTIHIVVAGDTYTIDVVPPTNYDAELDPISLELACDELGCEGEME